MLVYLVFHWENLDRWLCCYLEPNWFRLWWRKLWIRQDESHPSLYRDTAAECQMTETEQAEFMHDLLRRRHIAHERDLRRAY